MTEEEHRYIYERRANAEAINHFSSNSFLTAEVPLGYRSTNLT
jgi:hypothetical protein